MPSNSNGEKASLGLKLAALAGLLFLYVCYRALRPA